MYIQISLVNRSRSIAAIFAWGPAQCVLGVLGGPLRPSPSPNLPRKMSWHRQSEKSSLTTVCIHHCLTVKSGCSRHVRMMVKSQVSLSRVPRGRAICVSTCALAQSIWLQACVAPYGNPLVTHADHEVMMALKSSAWPRASCMGVVGSPSDTGPSAAVARGAEVRQCDEGLRVGTLPPRSRHHCLGVATDSSGVARRGRPSSGGGGEQPSCRAAPRVHCTALSCPRPAQNRIDCSDLTGGSQ